MVLQFWETIKESITAYTGLSPATFFTFLVLGLTLYYVVSSLFASSGDSHNHRRSVDVGESVQPLPPPVDVGEITADELKEYDGSDPKKPLLMAIKGQIYDVSQSRMFYGPGGPYALFAGKDASRALAKMSFEDKDLKGDLTGLGMFELEALQDWEYKFQSKYVKVGTVKATVPIVDSIADPTEGSESSSTNAEEAAEVAEAKPREIADPKAPEAPESDYHTKLSTASENGVTKPVEISESADAIKPTDGPRDHQNGIAKPVETSEIADTDAGKHLENEDDHKEKE